VSAPLLLAFGACLGFAFVAGAVWEYVRSGGTRDLETRLRTITRLRHVEGSERP